MQSQDSELDPLAGMANLMDVMMVFCCGLMVALVLSWNLQNVIFDTKTPEERKKMQQKLQKITAVDKGTELNEIPELNDGSGEGYNQMGTVFQDPKTGKLILIEGELSNKGQKK
ncbi:DUF2149 domain-containing protein [Tepidibacter aestuarii]|uniref:DUF2149 domain-containing protein n=1 Tax=Tepidibacter aestuarii TaxID=2925782 RepID=UPI0020C020D8|nr:DUF2149 domain-containing protein [Tepidibacter aestuarii]CAH2212462.1 DUF2149 domain-containing protein [Tepidibacter aestuarii]